MDRASRVSCEVTQISCGNGWRLAVADVFSLSCQIIIGAVSPRTDSTMCGHFGTCELNHRVPLFLLMSWVLFIRRLSWDQQESTVELIGGRVTARDVTSR